MNAHVTRNDLRAWAVGNTFVDTRSVSDAVGRLGFVQIDPIRAPAPAQDLILRHRVRGYAVGDADRAYPDSDLEEDVLYAYGLMPRSTQRLVQPRATTARHSALEKSVLELVSEAGSLHSRGLDAQLASKSVRNGWGGQSKQTKLALEQLQWNGHLRVAHREGGKRVYARARSHDPLPSEDRIRRLAVVVAELWAPVLLTTLRRTVSRIGRRLVGPRCGPSVIQDLLADGSLERHDVAGDTWIWPTSRAKQPARDRRVRFLAPFDPLVHDRDRFERLWGWAYRFEAYTPPAKRVRGYYALPLLYGTDVIGWANASVTDDTLRIDVGFERAAPPRRIFDRELRAETRRFAKFLGVRD